MKASALLLLVLALALVFAPLTAEAQKKKKDDDDDLGRSMNCNTLCEGWKERFTICRDTCELSRRVKEMTLARIDCGEKCFTQQKGPALKVCQEQCEKDYKAKVPQVLAACNKTCDVEKNPNYRNDCMSICTPPP